MLNCKTLTQQHASDFLEHQLPMRQRFSIRLHLVLCKNCRRFVNQLQLVRGVLQRRQAPLEDTQIQSIVARLYSAQEEQKKS
jgi:anti-sigma factor ChrR (cupin superfamily)